MMRRVLGMMGVLTLFASVASAQVGIYGKFDENHYSAVGIDGSSTWFHGGGVGVYDDFLKLGPVRGGLDLRGSFGASGQYDYRNVLGGVRVAFKAPVVPLRPYAEALVGVGGTRYTGGLAAGISGDAYSSKFTYEFLGGLDYTLIPHVDFRAIEIGLGRQSPVSSSVNSPATTVVAISTGVVIRL